MVSYLGDGRLIFTIEAPDASKVELVGAFHAWHEQNYPMTRDEDGTWTTAIDAGPGVAPADAIVGGNTYEFGTEADTSSTYFPIILKESP